MSLLAQLNKHNIPLGTYGPPLVRQTLSLSVDKIKTHAHVSGVSGSGKSRFLASFVLMLLRAGIALTLIDPHGDLARLVIAHLVKSGYFDKPAGFDKLLYLDLPRAERQGRFLPFNVLDQGFDAHTT